MISENTSEAPAAGEVSQQQTTPTLARKQSSSEERPARRSCQDFGTGGASTPGNASGAGSLPGSSGEDGNSSQRSRRKSVVPPKPKPPPVPSSFAAATGARRFCVQPYTSSPRSGAGMSCGSPPMARTALQTATGTSASSESRGSDEPDGQAVPAPVPPPRRRRHTPKSPGTSRAALVVKPDPPAVVPSKPTTAKEPVKPPVASPRRNIVLGNSTTESHSGEGCNGERTPTTDASVFESESNVSKTAVEQEQRKETGPVLPKNITDSSTTCNQGGTGGENPLSTDGNRTESKSLDTRPPIPPRLRKKGRVSGTSSPASSPKPSRARTLPQIPQPVAIKDAEDTKLRKTVSGTNTTDPETQNKSEVTSNNVVSGDSNTGSLANVKEVESAQKINQISMTQLQEEKDLQPFPNGAPPRVTLRRNMVTGTPRLPKPALPPKSEAVRRRSLQRPPIPRPRSFVPARTKEIPTNGEIQTSPPQKPSPVHAYRQGLLPGERNLAKSSPSVLAAVNEARGLSAASGKVARTPPRGRKASSVSPSHAHGRKVGPESPGHVMAGILKERRSTLPSHSVSAGHVTSPGHRTGRRSSDSPSRVRVLPTPPETNSHSLGEPNRAKSVTNILSLPCSPARHLPGQVPPKPPTRRRFSKSSSVADLLEMKDDDGSSDGSNLARKLVKELKRVTGDGVPPREENGEGEEVKMKEERQEPEGAEAQPASGESHQNPSGKSGGSERAKSSRLSFAKQRAVSVGDISLLETGPIAVVASDTSSYTSSEGRSSVMSSDHQSPLLERARQLSKNRKWCNQPEVKETAIVPNLAKEQLLQQEAIFEIITSEASYHLNLTTLIDRFMDDPKLDPNAPESVLDRTQHSMIFSNVKEIRSVSAKFLEDILVLFSEDVFLGKIFPVLKDYATDRFVCYERYCASQSHRLKELRECTEKSENFQRQLKRLEEEANQTLQSLVTAPMQRVTKLPLLMSEVIKRTPNDDPRREQMISTLRATEEVADLCNKGAGKIGDMIHLETIWKKLHFGQLKPFLMLAPGRKLKKEGAIDRLRVNKRKTRVLPDKVQHYLFVFTDFFMITTEEKDRHHVVDYCSLSHLSVESIANNPSPTLDNSSSSEDSYTMSGAEWTVAVAGEEHAFLVSLQESAAAATGRQGALASDGGYIFVVRSKEEKGRWMDILRERKTEEPVSTPKALTGRNLTLLTRKRQREVPTKRYWWKQPEVEQSGVVKTLTQLQLELQEAIFEVVTSEEEHLAAMETLVNHYMSDSGLDPSVPEEQRVLSEEEYSDIFRYINDAYHISKGLLKTLHARQRENVVVDTICDILLLCVERRFQGYIRYCTNLPNSLEQLDSSIEKNESFRGYLKQLEEDQRSLRSLLKAPMDRVTQLPHHLRTILRKTPTTDLNHCLVEATLKALEKVQRLCTSGQQKVEKIRELYSLDRQLDFGSIKPFSLVSVGRSLLKQGPLMKLKVSQWFGKAVRKKTSYVIILSDYLLITKRIDNVYKVMDFSLLDRVLVEVVEPHAVEHNSSLAGSEDSLAGARWAVSKAGENHAFLVTLPDVKRSYIFVATSEQERVRWIESMKIQNLMSFEDETDSSLAWEYFYMEAAVDYIPPSEGRAPEDLDMRKGELLRVYRANNDWCEGLRVHDLHWGRFPTKRLCHAPPGRREVEGAGLGECLVQVTHDFTGGESGELPLEKGDVVKVARQLAGWCEGKKLRGNQWGWFPRTHTQSMSTSRSSSITSSSRRPTLSSHHSLSPPPSPSSSSPISDLLLPPR